MHQASPDSSTARLPLSGTPAQNSRSRMSRCDWTSRPASLILSSWAPRICLRFSISWFMRSSIKRTELTLTSPRSKRSSAKRIARCSASCTITDSSGLAFAAWQLRHLLLERTGCGHSALPGANVPKTRQRAENPVDLFFAGRGMATASVALSRTESCTERRERANSAVSRYARNAWSYCGRLRSARPRSRTLTAFGALRSGNQFEQLLGVVQPLSEFLLVGAAKRCGGDLRGNARIFMARIGGHEINLIDVDALCASKGSFQLKRKLRWFGLAGGKSAHE